MKKFIVTTTIQKPTEATVKFSQKEDWQLIVVGDKKTPHNDYKNLNCIYLSPEEQEKKYPYLSKLLGWNCTERRNIGLIEAFDLGADIIAIVDDDNIPYDTWGQNLLLGKEIEATQYIVDSIAFDPLAVYDLSYWHRGYPVDIAYRCSFRGLPFRKSNVWISGTTKKQFEVQADLWNGKPDIDAITRIVFNDPEVFFEDKSPFFSSTISPFNSQNTFITRKALPYYFCFPEIGRMSDIWGSYIFQHYMPASVVYGAASVYQQRNQHDVIKDLADEMLGYRFTGKLLQDLSNWKSYLPERAIESFRCYQSYFHI